jgi:hypothetical protein
MKGSGPRTGRVRSKIHYGVEVTRRCDFCLYRAALNRYRFIANCVL